MEREQEEREPLGYTLVRNLYYGPLQIFMTDYEGTDVLTLEQAKKEFLKSEADYKKRYPKDENHWILCALVPIDVKENE